MQIINSTEDDIDSIFRLYEEAVEFQKTVFDKYWEGFERNLIETEIREKRQWKIIVNHQIACIFAITFNDVLIWQDKDDNSSIFLHRIVTSPAFRGRAFMKDIIEWAKLYGKENNKSYIRMDTWGDNQKLIDYYVKSGFTFLGITKPEKTELLPKHYENISLSLFEIKID